MKEDQGPGTAEDRHGEMVQNLIKSGSAIQRDLTPTNADLLHSAVGASGEAGELLDVVKKSAIYGRLLDREHVIEELGDLEFYMARIRQLAEVSREMVLESNMKKLGVRYASGSYSNEEAVARADKS